MTDFPRSPEDAELEALFVHDMRSPIAAIAANFGFLRTTPAVAEDPMALESLRDAESATLILQGLVDNMALLSALESAPCELALESVNLPETVLACLDRMSTITSASEVHIEVAIEPGARGPRVLAMPKLLRAAIDNVVHSAIRHTPRREHVHVQVLTEGARGVLEIRDGSPPVPPQLAAELFTRAGQRNAKKESSSRYGRGLGLLVTGLAVHASGGTVEVVERSGKNAYRISFPIG